MVLLVSGATKTVRRLASSARLGRLITPRSTGVAEWLRLGLPVAADNDCFQRLDRAAYIAMLRHLRPHAERVLWVTAPDVVGDAAATLARWRIWRSAIGYYGLRAAYVAQDGSEYLAPPWGELDALFIGGSTEWKEGEHARRLITEAKARGKWVHVGRVNTIRRVRLLSALDVDSIDGTQFSRWPDRWIPWIAPHLEVISHTIPGAFEGEAA